MAKRGTKAAAERRHEYKLLLGAEKRLKRSLRLYGPKSKRPRLTQEQYDQDLAGVASEIRRLRPLVRTRTKFTR